MKIRHPRLKPDRPLDLFRSAAGLCLILAWCLLMMLDRSNSGATQGQIIGAPEGAGWFAALAAVCLILLNALFVAAETAIDVLRPHHVRKLKEEDLDELARRVQKLIDRRPSCVAATTIGSQSSRFLLVVVAIFVGPSLGGYVFAPNSFAALMTGVLAVAIPLLVINIIFELIPRSYASLHPQRVGLALYRFIGTSSLVFSAPAWAVTQVASLLTRQFGGRASFAVPNQAEEEIKTLVETAQESGEIEEEEREMLHSVFEFGDTVVREVMTPRVDLDALSIDATPEAVLALIRESGHTRIPLFEQTDDAIVGIIHAKDLLMAMLSDQPVSLRRLMRAPMFVPENKDLHDLLKELRQGRSQMAIVQDEFGGTSGIVTIEDIVEEVVGEIVDEYDEEEPEIVEAAGGWLIDGRTHVDDVERATGFETDDEEFDTIGGLVFGLFGRQPSLGESVESEGYRFSVAETDGRRILRIKVEKG